MNSGNRRVLDVLQACQRWIELPGFVRQQFVHRVVRQGENVGVRLFVAIVVEGPRAVEGVRRIMGVTDPVQATPGSVRGDYA